MVPGACSVERFPDGAYAERSVGRQPLSCLVEAGGEAVAADRDDHRTVRGVRVLAGTDAPNPGTAHGASMHFPTAS